MANTNSDIVANLVASPPVRNDVSIYGGRMRIAQGAFEVAAADFDADDDTITLCILPSASVVHSIKVANDDLDGATASVFNLGIYDWDRSARALGNVVDEDYWATLVTQFQAAATLTELVAEAAWDIANYGTPLWEGPAALSADPGGEYAIVLTQTAAVASAQAGTVAFEIIYTLD